MLHVLLLILKITGLILAVLLGAVLLVLLLILFVPVRYRAMLYKREELRVCARVSWLLHIISVPVDFREGKLSVKLKVFGIPVKDFMEEKTEEEPPEKPEEEAAEKKVTEEKAIETEATETRADWDRERAETKVSGQKPPDPKPCSRPEKQSKKPGGGIFKKIRNLKYTFQRFCVKIKQTIRNIQNIRDFLEDERTKEAFRLCMEQLKVLLKGILPRNVRGEVHFGTEDPALTGEILGGISIFYPIFMDNVKVYPDFEQSCLEGELQIKGRLRLVTVVYIAIRLLLNKNIRYVYRRMNK